MAEIDLEALAGNCERASRVMWRWLKEGSSPWDRETTKRVMRGMASNGRALRARLMEGEGE